MRLRWIFYTTFFNRNCNYLFKSSIKGEIVYPKGKFNFGWDPIFKPHNSERTYAEMDQFEKQKFSLRKDAIQDFKNFLTAREVQN